MHEFPLPCGICRGCDLLQLGPIKKAVKVEGYASLLRHVNEFGVLRRVASDFAGITIAYESNAARI